MIACYEILQKTKQIESGLKKNRMQTAEQKKIYIQKPEGVVKTLHYCIKMQNIISKHFARDAVRYIRQCNASAEYNRRKLLLNKQDEVCF